MRRLTRTAPALAAAPARAAAALACAALACAPSPEPPAGAAERFETVLSDLDGNANALFAPSRDALYVVGGRDGSGMILRLAGATEMRGAGTRSAWTPSAWTRMAGGGARELFGVWGAGDDDVWAVGDGGAIRRKDGDAWVEEASGTGAALRGVWGASAQEEEVWAVGDGGTVLRRDGGGWSADRVSGVWGADLLRVWGDAERAWIVGRMEGDETLILGRAAGGDWNRVPSGVAADLSGVHGRDGEFFAVGATEEGTGVVLRNGGPGWAPTATPADPLAGVCLAPDALFAVGAFGYAGRAPRGADGALAEVATDTDRCLRAVWGDDLWGVWAAGGACPGAEVELGVVLHRGDSMPGGPIANEDFDAGAAPPDGGGPDVGPGLGPGEECPTGLGCEPPLLCWVIRPSPPLILCTHPCGTVDDCAGFDGPCCQDLEQNGVPAASVCVPESTGGCTE